MVAKKILITGGGGFVGLHLAEICLKAGHPTYVYGAHLDEAYIHSIVPDAVLIESSILARQDIRLACEGVDVVFHVAGVTSIPQTIEDPLGTHNVNVNGTLEVLEAARIAKVRRIVFTSSAAIYGNSAKTPLSEKLPYAPESPYALQKVIGEQYVQLWHSLFGLETTIIRPFNVYGLRQKGDSQHSGAITRFFESVKLGKPIEISGDGNQMRDFINVRDVASAMYSAAFNPNANGEIFNVGSGVGLSINEVMRTICEILDTPFVPTYVPGRAGDIKESVADISRARDILQWKPTVLFREGIAELAQAK